MKKLILIVFIVTMSGTAWAYCQLDHWCFSNCMSECRIYAAGGSYQCQQQCRVECRECSY